LPDAHPACLGSLLHGGVAVALADVVLIVGSRFNGNLLFGGPPLWNADQTILMVDHDEAAFSLNRPPALGLHGDAAAVLDQLAAAWTGEPRTAWAAEAQSWADGSRAHWRAESEQPAAGVHPGALAREVAAFAAEQGTGTTVVLDGGDILGWGLAFIRAEEPGSLLFTSDALGTIGVGVPYAVGAALARPDGPTVALVGDGAFGLSAMEIETAVRAGAAPVIVVSNNASWGDVRYEEGEWFGDTVGTDLTPARYDLLCAALGGHGERVEALEDLRPALERARAAGVVSVVDVRTDPDRPNEVLRSMGALALQ
jgi:acetolactate synthase-1/2/3 large subunit